MLIIGYKVDFKKTDMINFISQENKSIDKKLLQKITLKELKRCFLVNVTFEIKKGMSKYTYNLEKIKTITNDDLINMIQENEKEKEFEIERKKLRAKEIAYRNQMRILMQQTNYKNLGMFIKAYEEGRVTVH